MRWQIRCSLDSSYACSTLDDLIFVEDDAVNAQPVKEARVVFLIKGFQDIVNHVAHIQSGASNAKHHYQAIVDMLSPDMT